MRFRDRKTGRFVSRATWRRSKAHGGKRYVRERPRKLKKLPPPPPPAPEYDEYESQQESVYG